MFEILDKNIKSLNYSSSINITYPRSINIIFGNYPYPDVTHNLLIDIKNNLSEDMENYTNVKGGMTEWNYFLDNPLFKNFISYLINKHQFTHPHLFEYFFDKMFLKDAWGNEIKKGDSLNYHTHPCYHGILYLSSGCNLILPELNMQIKPKAGDYYIFPPEILHGFSKSEEDNKRYSLIFNMEQKDYNFELGRIIKKINEKQKT